MRVIITGGTGLIGRALVADLLRDKHEVIVLSRRPAQYQGQMPPGTRLEAWDGHSAAGWGGLVEGTDAIVNLAGAGIADQRWSRKRKELILQSRLQAGRAVVAAIQAAAHRPAVLLQASAIGYYGPRQDEMVLETTPAGHDFLGQVVTQWENVVAPVRDLRVRLVIMRTGLVLSPDGGALPQLLRPFKFMAGGPLGSGEQWYSWIHITDQVRAMRFLLATPTAEGVYNLTAPTPVTNRVFANTLGHVLERPALAPAPAIALKLLLGEMSTAVLEGQRVLPHRLQQAGFQFRYSTLEHALRDLLT